MLRKTHIFKNITKISIINTTGWYKENILVFMEPNFPEKKFLQKNFFYFVLWKNGFRKIIEREIEVKLKRKNFREKRLFSKII